MFLLFVCGLPEYLDFLDSSCDDDDGDDGDEVRVGDDGCRMTVEQSWYG